MNRRLWQQPVVWCAALVLVAVLGVGAALRLRDRTPASHTVTIDAARFEPAVSVMKVGDAITWINKDLVPHTATARNGSFNSGAIDPGKSFTYKATHAGDVPYFCVFHPTMTALLRVQ